MFLDRVLPQLGPAFGYNLNRSGTLGLPSEETCRKMSELRPRIRERGSQKKQKPICESQPSSKAPILKFEPE